MIDTIKKIVGVLSKNQSERRNINALLREQPRLKKADRASRLSIALYPGGTNQNRMGFQMFLGALLRRRGHLVWIVCDAANLSVSKFHFWAIKFKNLFLYGKNRSKIIFIGADALADMESITQDEYDQARIDEHIRSALIAHYKDERFIADRFFSQPATKNDIDRFTNRCIISQQIGKYLLTRFSIDTFITNHGIYSKSGPLYDFLKYKGVKCFIYGYQSITEKTDSFYLGDGRNSERESSRLFNSFLEKTPISEKIENIASSYVQKRTNLIGYDVEELFDSNSKHRNSLSELDKTIAKLKPEYIFGLFPNVIYDHNVVQRNTIYSGITEWILDTINSFSNEKYLLILRMHPSETTVCRQFVATMVQEIIFRNIKDLSDRPNIFLIKSDNLLNSYKLIKDYIDCCIVYDNMIGAEAQYLGSPVIAAARGPNVTKYWTIQPESKEMYSRLLRDHEKVERLWKENKAKYTANLHLHHYYNLEESYSLPFINKLRAKLQDKQRVDLSDLTQYDLNVYQNNCKRLIAQIENPNRFISHKDPIHL